MIVVDEFFHHSPFYFSTEALRDIFQEMKKYKEKEIEVLKEKIRKYEKTRRAHEVWYQSLSPVRKFFAGRPSSQHQAVEYIVNVKERFIQIEQIKRKITFIADCLLQLENHPDLEQITVPAFMMEEIKEWKENGGFLE